MELVGIENILKELRKKRGVSQAELANALDVSRQTIISIESGRYTASLPLAIRISRYFQTPVEEIFLLDELE